MSQNLSIKNSTAFLAVVLFVLFIYQTTVVATVGVEKQVQPTKTSVQFFATPILYTTLLENLDRSIGIIPINNLSETVHLLNESLQNVRNPVWSQSRQKILYAIQNGDDMYRYRFGVLDASGNKLYELTEPLYFEASVNGAWSHDDQYIASIISSNRYDLNTHNLVVIKTDGTMSQTRQVISDGVWSYGWSPVDNRLAVIKWDKPSDSGLHIVDIDGSRLDFFPADDYFQREVPTLINMSWGADGQQIAITNLPDEINLATGELTKVEEVYAIDLESRDVEQLTDEQENYLERSISCLNWSPDGKTIAFVSNYKSSNNRTRRGMLVTVDIESRVETHLVTHVVDWACPVWSSDGQEIAFIGIVNPQQVNGDVYSVEVQTNTVKRLTKNSEAKNDLTW